LFRHFEEGPKVCHFEERPKVCHFEERPKVCHFEECSYSVISRSEATRNLSLISMCSKISPCGRNDKIAARQCQDIGGNKLG
jgi:hypothetical protein